MGAIVLKSTGFFRPDPYGASKFRQHSSLAGGKNRISALKGLYRRICSAIFVCQFCGNVWECVHGTVRARFARFEAVRIGSE